MRKDATHDHNDEDICRRVAKLILSLECHFQGDAECLDSHNGDRAGRRANRKVYEGILSAMLRSNLVYHDNREYGDECAVEQKSYAAKLLSKRRYSSDWAGARDIPGWRA